MEREALTISEVIELLQGLMDKHGDLPVIMHGELDYPASDKTIVFMGDCTYLDDHIGMLA